MAEKMAGACKMAGTSVGHFVTSLHSGAMTGGLAHRRGGA